jgi:hypothetical protein
MWIGVSSHPAGACLRVLVVDGRGVRGWLQTRQMTDADARFWLAGFSLDENSLR